jgi:hypothetical protein
MTPQLGADAVNAEQPVTAARISRLVGAVLLAALVAGCDRCGNLFPIRGEGQVCRDDAPVKPAPSPIY